MRRLRLETGIDRRRAEYAVEAALLLGFQAETAEFPVIGSEGEIEIPENDGELGALWRKEGVPSPEGYQAAHSAGPVFDLDFREKTGLECIFGKGPFLKDEDQDLFPDRLDVKLALPDEIDASILTAACNLAYRFGMETTAYAGRIVAEEGYRGNAVILERADSTELCLEETEGAVRVVLRGEGEELERFSAQLCERFPKIDEWKTWRDVLMEMIDDFVLRGADGQLAHLAAAREACPDCAYEVYGSPELADEQKAHFPDTTFYNYKSGKKVYEKTYELPWEVEVFEQLLRDEVYPRLRKGDTLRVSGALSEDADIRKKLANRIAETAGELGVNAVETQIICAYKQGFSWMDEAVIPAIKAEKPERIEIYFKPFLPEGQTEWLDENGATPSYNNVEANNPDKWYDLPIRYLQELYPIEDILVRELGIAREQVVFLPYEGEEELTYLCRAVKQGGICYENRYLAHCSERPYLDSCPELGKVHPATGYIEVKVNGEEILNREIRTDLEGVWEVYQTKVLPDVRSYIEEKTGGEISPEKQPFFHELLLDVTVSEPDYRTGSREDLISSLDALHEDLYFTGSDFFKNYGVQKHGVMLDAPGLILPQLHNAPGRPVFQVTLYDQLSEEPYIARESAKDGSGSERLCGQRRRSEVSLTVSRITCEEGGLVACIRAEGVERPLLKAYAGLLERGVLKKSREFGGWDILRFEDAKGVVCEASIPARPARGKTKRITDIDLHENELIGYDTYLEIIEELRQVPQIEVFESAVSYTGRKLYAIWLKPEYTGYLSLTKRLNRIPSEIINARHHANEVSSTNASFILLKRLLTEEKYRELPERLNLVLVPMENVDGAAIHYELQKEHPYWKFHVARFNSLGKEFYHEHFRQDTIHTEAMGLSRLYERFVPDMVVDNHGVPSHEWEQQFSGYTSPSYKGFWLPRSLLYGYFWYVTDPEYRDNYAVNKRMEDVIADRIAEDDEMTALNREWSAQFEKYAHAWMPKLFPADYYKNMINYWIPFAYDPAHRYPSIRYPWITTVAYTSEVADETAQGDYLNLCARAHAAHDEVTIEMLMRAGCPQSAECGTKDEIFARCVRQRPVIV